MNRRIIVFAPHPDDEVLGCGGIIAKKVSEGWGVFIVIMTDGKDCFSKVFGIHVNPSTEELKQVRREESKRAAAILGVPLQNVIFLDFEDGKLFKNAEKAEEITREILKQKDPAEVYYPYGKDDHIDHRETNRIINNSMKKLGSAALQFQYSLYMKHPRISSITNKIISTLKQNTVHVNVSEFLPLKEAALQEHKSQVTVISSNQPRPIIAKTKSFLKNKETFYIIK